MTNPWQRDKNPKEAPKIYKYVPPPAPTTLCVDCGDPTFDYEYGEGGEVICLWCQILRSDRADFS